MRAVLFISLCLVATGAATQGPPGADPATRSTEWPIVLIVPFPPGGSADRIGTIVARAMSDSLKRTVVTRGMPAGIGVEALAAVATPVFGEIRLGYATSTQVVTATLLTRPVPYNPSEDFDWIGVLGTFPNAMIAGPHETAPSFEHWLKAVPERGRPVRVGAGAPGSMGMLAAQFLRDAMAGYVEVSSYASADAGYGALRSGAIDVYVDGLPNALQETARAGSRILAVTSRDRAVALPQVPAFGERWPNEDFSSFVAIVIARSESEAIRARVKSGWYGVLRAGSLRGELSAIGFNYLGLDLDAAPAFVEREFLRHAKLLGRAGRTP